MKTTEKVETAIRKLEVRVAKMSDTEVIACYEQSLSAPHPELLRALLWAEMVVRDLDNAA